MILTVVGVVSAILAIGFLISLIWVREYPRDIADAETQSASDR